MIAPNQIVDEINRLLVKKYPERTVYINRCPKDFKRPSFWLETVGANTEDVNFSTVRMDISFFVTCFIEISDYGSSDGLALTKVQDAVASLFRKGYIQIGDRAIKVKANTSGYDSDRSYVDLQFDFFDDRSDKAENLPLIKDVTLKKE